MAFQIDTALYKTIADSYALIDDSLTTISTNARTSVNAIVDVVTSKYPTGDPSGGNPDAALEIELALLTPFNTSYNSSINTANSVSFLFGAIDAVNNHVINNTSGTGTAKVKLDTWINTTMNSVWDTECPAGWANLCSDAGYDTTDWTTT